MKKLILSLIIFSGLFSLCNAQRVQGTIRNTNAASMNEVIVSIKPTAAFTALMSNLIVAVQIPTSVGPRPTISFANLQPSLFASWTQLDADQGDGFYTWAFNCVTPGGSNTSTTNWAVAELDVLKVTFIGSPVPPFTARLCHYLDGGTGGFAIFYVETNLSSVNGGVLSDWGNLFYGASPSNGAKDNGAIGVPNALLSFTNAPNVTLPIKFLSFNATKKSNDAVLTWQVEDETNITDRYEIERSVNGVDFKKVNTVAPKNNGNTGNSYELIDLNLSAIGGSTGVVYYRIKQVDKDGQFIYSGVKNIRLNARPIAVSVYPNPVRSFANLTIDLEQDAAATVTIIDAAGKQLRNIQMKLFKGANIKKIDMESLSAGNYILMLQTPTENTTIPVVKSN